MTAPVAATYQPTLQIAFQHSIGWDFRLLIARVTGRPVHVASIYDDVLYEAAFTGMRRVPASVRLKVGSWEVFTVPRGYNATNGLALAESRMNPPWAYDWTGAIYAWWLGKPAGSAARNKVFCSEEMSDELIACGVPLSYRRTAHYTPRSLRDELRARGFPSYWIDAGALRRANDAAAK